MRMVNVKTLALKHMDKSLEYRMVDVGGSDIIIHSHT